jgi:putative transposase
VRLAAEVRRLFDLHQGKRGSPMITADLKDAGWRVSKNTVAALMAEQRLAARPRRRRRATTRPGRGRWRAPDLVKREFPAARLNHKWYGDGTEIATSDRRPARRRNLPPIQLDLPLPLSHRHKPHLHR